jgi:FAD/FMN-containing dehydrogenase
MKRREFCRNTLAASLAATYPFLAACGREAPTPTAPAATAAKAETGVPAITLDGASIELEKAAIRELGQACTGEILLAGQPGYDSARKVWNGMHDKHPALIARCVNEGDVQNAVTFARERDLLVAVRGGGHSWPGKSVCDGGMMIDLALMHDAVVDPSAQQAMVQGGALLGHLDTASLAHGLVTTAGVVSHTGVGGFTLGGGFGRLNRKYGLAVDNLLGADIVTADGQLRTVSAQQEPDLFWAIRGGGGNFGVVTRFRFQLHPFDRNVLSGMIMWPVAQAREVLTFYSDWYSGLSDDLYVGPVMVTTPDGTSLVGFEVVYAGDPVLGEKELEPMRRIGQPLDDGIKLQDYTVMQTQEDAAFAHGVRSYIKNGMVREITPGLIDAMIESFVPDPRLAMFTHTSGGAVTRVDDLATAFPHRNAETMVMVGGGWMDPAQDEEAMTLARNWFAQLAPFTGGFYDNIDFDAKDPAGENYGPAYSRLAEIKGRYDPGNLFRLNRNVKPSA